MNKTKRFIIYESKKKLVSTDTYEEACDFIERLLPVERISNCSIKDTEFKP
jgi:hypothetical protein